MLIKIALIFLCLCALSTVNKTDTIPIDHWFFVQPMLANNTPQNYKIKTKNLIVHTDETFGVAVHFASFKPNAKIQIKLIVPSKPENFPCKGCKPGEFVILPDGHTVIVNKIVDSSAGLGAFFWGIDAEDPRGKYQISLTLDDVEFSEKNKIEKLKSFFE